jgi:hypothetical protein
MATDQEIRDAGILYMPKQKYLQNPYELPIAPVPSPTSEGIVNTNAFANSGGGGGGGALQVGDPMMNFDNYYNYTGNKYMQNQDTPNVDMTYDQKLQSNFMGMPSYRQQQLTGPDMGEYIGSGTNIPLEQTMAGKIQSGVQGAGKGIKNLMGMLPTPSNLLNKFGIQNFSSLSPADQLFIKTNSGYRGPTVFGENTSGLSKDPFGLNTESLIGNYAGAVRDNYKQLEKTLTKDSRATDGVTFNEVTGEFESDKLSKEELAAYNKKTNMIRKKFLFRKKQTDQQKKNQRDIDKKAAQDAKNAAVANQNKVEAYTGRPMSDYRQSRPQSEQNYTGGDTNSNPSTPGAQDSFSNKSGMGRTGYFFGGRVGFKNGGLASIL